MKTLLDREEATKLSASKVAKKDIVVKNGN